MARTARQRAASRRNLAKARRSRKRRAVKTVAAVGLAAGGLYAGHRAIGGHMTTEFDRAPKGYAHSTMRRRVKRVGKTKILLPRKRGKAYSINTIEFGVQRKNKRLVFGYSAGKTGRASRAANAERRGIRSVEREVMRPRQSSRRRTAVTTVRILARGR